MELRKELNLMLRLAEIERKDMPQIKSDDLPIAMNHLKNVGVDIRIESISINNIKPTQEDFIPEKVDSIVKSINSGNSVPPITISADNYIVDGHHRWLAAKKISSEDGKINVVKINLPISSALKAYESVSKE